MADGIVITAAKRADLADIHRIETESFPEPWRREFFDGELRSEGRYNIVARRGAEVVGYLFSMWVLDEMHVNKIAVTEPERRKGIADDLMNACFRFAQEHEIRSIALEVRKSNRGAQEFYKHLAFAPAYLRPRYYPDGEAAVVMVRDMTAA